MMSLLEVLVVGGFMLLHMPEFSAVEVTLFSCGFETDFCGMIKSTNGHFDWTRHSESTPTGDTGPSSAYKGSFYIYMEADTAHTGDQVAVKTPSLQHSGTACVTFAYHMYGSGIGYLAMGNSSSSAGDWKAFSDQGDHWRLGTADVTLRPGDQVSFKAFPTNDDHGDIALDDISVRTGGCRTLVRLPFSCSFEEGFCGMLQSNDDHFDWTRFDRPTDHTGPHEAGEGTWFIYIETDHLRFIGDIAKIETPALDFRGPICVRFMYHMPGAHGLLLVQVFSEGKHQQVFVKEGNQGKEWQTGAINVSEIQPGDWVSITGRRGKDPGDIGFDRIVISPNPCPDSECTKDNGGCDQICSPTFDSHTCSCRRGYRLEGTSKCVDVNECTDHSHLCSDGCQNNNGSYACTCPDGMQVEGYSCIAQSCYEAYDKIVDANAFKESLCETEATLYNITRDACVLEACRRGVEVVAVRPEVCDLKRCEDRTVQPVTAADGVGWDIFRLNVTRPGSPRPPFPLMAVAVGAAVAVLVLTAMAFTAAVAVHLKKRRASNGREPGNRPTDGVTNPRSVNRENEPTSTCLSFDNVTAPSNEHGNEAMSRDGSIGDVTGTPDEGVYQAIDDTAIYLNTTTARWSPRPHPSPAAYENMTELASRLKGVYANIGTATRDTHNN